MSNHAVYLKKAANTLAKAQSIMPAILNPQEVKQLLELKRQVRNVRNLNIAREVACGASLKTVAARYKLSVPRISQIVCKLDITKP